MVSGNNKIGTVKSVATKGVSVYSQKKEGHWGLKATTSYPRIYGSIGIIVFPQNDKHGIPLQKQPGDKEHNFLAFFSGELTY